MGLSNCRTGSGKPTRPGRFTKKRRLFCYRLLLFTVIFLLLIAGEAAAVKVTGIIHFPDLNLEFAVRDALGKSAGVITEEDMLQLRSLSAAGRGIEDLTALEHAVNLQHLDLSNNQITDLTPLSGLGKLQSLNLHYNEVSDLSPLTAIFSLQKLYLAGNGVSSTAALKDLAALRELHLGSNQAADISALSGLLQLEALNLSDNHIKEISALENLSRLTYLRLDGNPISDFSPLRGLSRLKHLQLGGQQLDSLHFLEALTGLEQLILTGAGIDDLDPLQNLYRLQWLDLQGNSVSDITPLHNLKDLQYLNLNNNRVDDITVFYGLDSLVWLEMENNYLQIEEGSTAMEVIKYLKDRNVLLDYRSQERPLYEGSGAVHAPPGSGGSLLRTAAGQRFRIINYGRGWRVKGFTVAHGGGKPLDHVAEIGYLDPGGAGFRWHAAGSALEKGPPYSVTLNSPSPVALAIGVRIWPGYRDDPARTFYFSEVVLENIHSGDTYTITIEPPGTPEDGPSPEETAHEGTAAGEEPRVEEAR